MQARDATQPSPAGHAATEYALSGVRYSADRTQIYKVRVHRVRPGSVDPPLEILRRQLVAALEFGRTIVTLGLDGEGAYAAQATVRLVHVEGQGFLRCDGKQLPSDHLPGVPEF